jgi:predicted phage terminase large subunit-like protein
MVATTTTSRRAVISPARAQQVLATRELARRHLVNFGVYVNKNWIPAAHHILLAEKLEQVYKYIESGGEEGIGRLIVQMPPQHGKSEVASRLFPAWLLGKRPDSRCILGSYGAGLANKNSRAVRDIVIGQKFKSLFGQNSAYMVKSLAPVEISKDTHSVENWELEDPYKGGVLAAGVGGGITGHPADYIAIDDPFKNRKDAESEFYRAGVIDWYGSSVYTRLGKGGAIVVINTRWGREDLSGFLIKAMGLDPLADMFDILSLPALAFEESEYATSSEEQREALLNGFWIDMRDPIGRKPGEALWPFTIDKTGKQIAKFPRDKLLAIKANLEVTSGIEDWYALYQQKPISREGAFFTTEDLKIEHSYPAGMRWYRFVDLAISEKKTADFNATVAVALDKDGKVYLRDMLRVKGWIEFKEQLKALMLSENELGTIWGVETVNFQKLAFQELMRDPDLAKVIIHEVTTADMPGDKVEKARPLQSRARTGLVKLVRGTWNTQFISEALDFPNGSHDDQVDSASGGLGMVATEANTPVYGDFGAENISELEYDPTKPFELAVRDGYIEPRAILFIQKMEDAILVFDEIYHEKRQVESDVMDVLEKCIKLSLTHAERLSLLSLRPEDASSQDLLRAADAALGDSRMNLEELITYCSEKNIKLPEIAVGSPEDKVMGLALREANIPFRGREHERVDGIQRVRKLIKDVNGNRKLLVNARSHGLIRELSDGYRYKVEGSQTSEDPIEKNCQAADALRFWSWIRAK